ncbi:hypothetical protein GCM10022226_17320 [Sphaerisporangium flaviroseum]|uniref:Uncharacterized protein n=1 Tax=Sphaerisporangium flaviroseum TaxID=509199 RepID=A0ABP7HQA8_9ACTN
MLEEDLREALRARASTYEASPHAWLEVQRRGRTARRRGRAMLVAVPLAAGAVLAGVPIAMLNGGPGPDTAARTTTEPPSPYRDAYEAAVAEHPPIGATLTINDPTADRPMRLWFANEKTKEGTRLTLCAATQHAPGGSVSWCSDDQSTRTHEEPLYGGSTATMIPGPDTLLAFGATPDTTERVAAVAKDGTRLPGTIHRLDGVPKAVWTVTYPPHAKATSVELSDARGAVVETVRLPVDPKPVTSAPPVGPAAKPGAGVTARLHTDASLVWRHDGKVIALNVIASTPVVKPGETLADALRGNEAPVMSRFADGFWVGYARAGTERVRLTLADGRTVTTGTVPDPWHHDAVLFAAPFTVGNDVYADGYRITGLDGDGTELWHHDVRPSPPLWEPSPSASPSG